MNLIVAVTLSCTAIPVCAAHWLFSCCGERALPTFLISKGESPDGRTRSIRRCRSIEFTSRPQPTPHHSAYHSIAATARHFDQKRRHENLRLQTEHRAAGPTHHQNQGPPKRPAADRASF